MKILITGDSWASGEWVQTIYGPDAILPRLLGQDGHEVVLIAHPAGSDVESLRSAVDYNHAVDVIIFYKTSTQRILRDPRSSTLVKELLEKNNSNFDAVERELDNHTYRTLEELDCRVFLIGGLDKIKQKVDVEYVLPSLIEELTDSDVLNHYDETDIDNILRQCPEYFYPDGNHPNHKGIKHTYNLIKAQL